MISFVFKRRRRVNGKMQEATCYSAKLRMPWDHKTHIIPLEISDRREAERELVKIENERRQEHNGMLPPQSVRTGRKALLTDLLGLFLADLKAKGRAVNTSAKYQSNLQQLFNGCGWMELRSVNAQDFCAWRNRSRLSPKTLNDMLATGQTFLNWLVRQRMETENPLKFIERVDTRLVQRYRRALSRDEAARLLETAPRFRAVVYLLVLETGIRRNELNQVTVADFVFDTPTAFVRLPASITKNKREAQMRLRPHVVAAVRSVLPDCAMPYEFVFKNRIPRMETVKRDLLKAGIPFVNQHGRVDLHALRVTFCTTLLVGGASPRVVQELMRHSDIKLTMKVYTDPSQLPLAAALDLLPSYNLGNYGAQNGAQNGAQTGVLAVLGESSTDTAGQTNELLQHTAR